MDILLPKTKPIFVGLIYRSPNNINSWECFDKHLNDINIDNRISLLGDFSVNLLHNGNYIIKENQAIQNRIPSVQHAACNIDLILTNSREKISQSSVIDIGISDYQSTYLTRKLHRMKSNTHKQIKIRSLKSYTIESLNQGLRMINFPDYEYFNDVDIAYSDFIQCITRVTNRLHLTRR